MLKISKIFFPLAVLFLIGSFFWYVMAPFFYFIYRIDKFIFILTILLVIVFIFLFINKNCKRYVRENLAISILTISSVILIFLTYSFSSYNYFTREVGIIRNVFQYNLSIANYILNNQTKLLYNNYFHTDILFNNSSRITDNMSDKCQYKFLVTLSKMEGANKINDSIHFIYNLLMGSGWNTNQKKNADLASDQYYESFFNDIKEIQSNILYLTENCH